MTTTIIASVPEKKLIALRDEFGEYDLKDLNEIPFDIFIYDYEGGSYEGSGFSIWKNGKDYFYHELGHCSCNGPTDGINSSKNVAVTLDQIKEIVAKGYGDHGKNVLKYIEENHV